MEHRYRFTFRLTFLGSFFSWLITIRRSREKFWAPWPSMLSFFCKGRVKLKTEVSNDPSDYRRQINRASARFLHAVALRA
jgi:hypothetical protein